MPSYPTWIDEAESVFLRKIARGLFVGAKNSTISRHWDLVIDLHGIDQITANKTLVCSFPDGNAFPSTALDQIYAHVERVMDEGGDVLIACEMGRSRSTSAAYAMLRTVVGIRHTEAYRRICNQMTIPIGTKRTLVVTYPRRKTHQSAQAWAEAYLEKLGTPAGGAKRERSGSARP